MFTLAEFSDAYRTMVSKMRASYYCKEPPLRPLPYVDGYLQTGPDGTIILVKTDERGFKLETQQAGSLDDTLYWFANNLHPPVDQNQRPFERESHDPRRIKFHRDLELMLRISEDWFWRKRQEIDAILKEHPFDDDVLNERWVPPYLPHEPIPENLFLRIKNTTP